MLRIGVIGFGFMGRTHFRHWQALPDATVVAVCDERPIDANAAGGNLGDTSSPVDLQGVAVYQDVETLLGEAELDAVSITLPSFLHKDVSIQCLEAGAHVLCEKPMALSLEDCDAMMAASEARGNSLMIAHCIRFWPEYVWVADAVQSKLYGRLRRALFSRKTYCPVWTSGGWLMDEKRSGGIALDLHIHDLDFVQYILGRPQAQQSRRLPLPNGMTGQVETQLSYEDCHVTAVASWLMPESFAFRMSFDVITEGASMHYDSRHDIPLTVYTASGDVLLPELPQGDGYAGEIEAFAAHLRGEGPVPLQPSSARESVRMALETLTA